MYLVQLKAMLVDAVKQVFTDAYPVTEFASLHVDLAFPTDAEQYPGVLVDYDDSRPLQIAGHGQTEFTSVVTGGITGFQTNTRWLYNGKVSFTLYSMSSLERDRLYDEFVKMIAFGRSDPVTSPYRAYIESNEFIACGFDWDQIEPGGKGEAPGTDFGTDELIYEITLSMDCFGEFVSDPTGSLLMLSNVQVDVYGPSDTDPDTDPTTNVHEAIAPPAYSTDPTDWH